MEDEESDDDTAEVNEESDEDEKPKAKSKSKSSKNNKTKKSSSKSKVRDASSEDEDAEEEDSDNEPELKEDEPKKVLTHKEKKELKKRQKFEAEQAKINKKGGEGHSELGENFTVAQALKTGGALAQMETAVDIKIDKFSIAAKGKDLFRDASLLIAQGNF